LLARPDRLRRNLLVVRAGDGSVHPAWTRGVGERNFDLLVSYYGRQPDRFRDTADIYHAMVGPRWPAHAAICRENIAFMAAYDFVAFACDDLSADLDTWNGLFAMCRSFELDLAQPAIAGEVTFDITRPVEDCALRYTDFVEIMCPIFSRRALALLHGTFSESVSGWGLDFLWRRELMRRRGRMAIIDCLPVRHTRAARVGPLYKRLSEQGVDPGTELKALMAKWGFRRPRPRELGRVVVGDNLSAPNVADTASTGAAPFTRPQNP
jgi:hypothetical protein